MEDNRFDVKKQLLEIIELTLGEVIPGDHFRIAQINKDLSDITHWYQVTRNYPNRMDIYQIINYLFYKYRSCRPEELQQHRQEVICITTEIWEQMMEWIGRMQDE